MIFPKNWIFILVKQKGIVYQLIPQQKGSIQLHFTFCLFYRSVKECIAMFLPLGTYTAFAFDKTTRSCTSGFKELTKLSPPGMDPTNSIQIYTVPGKARLLVVSYYCICLVSILYFSGLNIVFVWSQYCICQVSI